MQNPTENDRKPDECAGCAVAVGSALPKLRYKLPPEMSDGQHWTVVDTKEAVIEAVGAWLAEADADGEITIKTCMMTDEEVNALPPI
jgi:hypothetical protein